MQQPTMRTARRAVLAAAAVFAFGWPAKGQCQRRDNGISVQAPEIYDDQTLRLFLAGLAGQFNAMNPYNPAALQAAATNLQGATTEAQSIALAPKGTNVTPANIGSPPTAAPPIPAGLALGPGPIDALADQTGLAYEIASLQLQLNGSVTGEYMPGPYPGTTDPSRQIVVLGFTLGIVPDERFRGDAADVSIELILPYDTPGKTNTLPRIVDLIPETHWTYEVTNSGKDADIGVGVASKILDVAANLANSRQSQYVWRDTDMVAYCLNAGRQGQASFGWQFRPVLHRKLVDPGIRHLYAVLSLPPDPHPSGQGRRVEVRVSSKWRSYSRKTGAVGEAVCGSGSAAHFWVDVPSAREMRDLTSAAITGVSWQPIGGGQALVEVTGRNFVPGMSVQVGAGAEAQPQPAAAQPQLPTPQPQLAAAVSPATAQPQPAAPQPQPAVTQMQPAAPQTQPAAPQTQPAAAQPAVIAAVNNGEAPYTIPVASQSPTTLQFMVPLASLAESRLVLVSPGKAQIIASPRLPACAAALSMRIVRVRPERERAGFPPVADAGEQKVRVTAVVDLGRCGAEMCWPVVAYGSQVFYGDDLHVTQDPCDACRRLVAFCAPADLVRSARCMQIADPFRAVSPPFRIAGQDDFTVAPVQLLSADTAWVRYAVPGTGFNSDTRVTVDGQQFPALAPRQRAPDPSGAQLTLVSPELLELRLTPAQAQATQSVYVSEGRDSTPVVEQLPPCVQSAPVAISNVTQIAVGDGQDIVFTGIGLLHVLDICYGGKALTGAVFSPDGTTIKLLRSDATVTKMTTAPGPKLLVLRCNSQPAISYTLNVANPKPKETHMARCK